MSFIQREIDKLRSKIASQTHPRHHELYAAQQALEWAIEPHGVKSPFDYLTGSEEGSKGCSAQRHQPQS